MRVINEIKRRNNVKEFVTKFAAQNGYPVWNKVLMGTSQKQYAHASLTGNSLDGATDTTILIPFVMEGEFSVKGFIKATLNDSVSLSYSLAKDYKAYEEKLDNSKTASSAFAMLSMVLNKTVFNEDYYKITNPKLFSEDTAHVSTQSIKIENISFTITESAGLKYISLCGTSAIYKTYCPENGKCSEDGTSCDVPPSPCPSGGDICFCSKGQCYNYLSNSTTCSTIVLPDVSFGGGDGSGGDNGGGGEIPYVYPCETTQNNPSPFTATNNIVDTSDCPVPGPGDGWLPWQDEPGEYNPYIADEVILDTSITNNYPCLVNIIDTLSTYSNINQTAQVALNTIFGVNKYIHTTIKIDPTLSGQPTSAETDAIKSDLNEGFDTVHYNITIRLNPDMMDKSTKEYIASTITHEVMHGYIQYIFKQYYLEEVDSNYVKSLFPIFWGTVGLAPSTQQEHQLMANNWVSTIANSLNAFTNNEINSSLKDSIYRSLGWGGLHDTDAFKLKPNKCNILAINFVAANRNVPSGSLITFPLYSECSQVYSFNADSLKLKAPCE